MMKATFETAEFGKVEVKRHNSDGSWSGSAYFFAQDFEVEVCPHGQFYDIRGRNFQVFWPLYDGSGAVLEVTMPRQVGRAEVERKGE